VAVVLDHGYASTKVVGRSNVPKSGPAILAGNHTGLLDGPVVLGAAPRGVHFIMKWSLGQGLGGLILRAAGQVPVEASGGREALRTCLSLLEAGRLVGIFPEGTRGDGRMRQIHPGVAWLAVHSGAPVIPFACVGTRRQGEPATKFPPFRRRVHVAFGPALELDLDLDPDPAAGGDSRRQQIAAAAEQIAKGLAAHVEAAVAACQIALPTDTGREPK
jgi:1-acyl-sn-glycerol-3-phosphate acyltransferase